MRPRPRRNGPRRAFTCAPTPQCSVAEADIEGIVGLVDATSNVGVAGLVSSRCQIQMRANFVRAAEALRIIIVDLNTTPVTGPRPALVTKCRRGSSSAVIRKALTVPCNIRNARHSSESGLALSSQSSHRTVKQLCRGTGLRNYSSDWRADDLAMAVTASISTLTAPTAGPSTSMPHSRLVDLDRRSKLADPT